MAKNSLFEYSDFYQFLENEIEKISRLKRGEKKKIAEELNIPPSLLSQIFSGTRKLSLDQVHLLCDYMGHSILEKEYIFNLFHLSTANNKKLKEILKNKCLELKNKSLKISERVEKDRVLSEREKSILYSSWYYIAIWAYVSIGEGKTVDEITTYFNLPIKKVKEVLSFLIETQICKSENGKIIHHLNRTHIEKNSPHFRQHHNNWRIRSVQKLDFQSEEDLNFTAPLSLSTEDFFKVREEMMKLIQGIYKTVKETEPEKVYCINIDFFSV
jgi:uncharacterized protein (TIGR02147 family)